MFALPRNDDLWPNPICYGRIELKVGVKCQWKGKFVILVEGGELLVFNSEEETIEPTKNKYKNYRILNSKFRRIYNAKFDCVQIHVKKEVWLSLRFANPKEMAKWVVFLQKAGGIYDVVGSHEKKVEVPEIVRIPIRKWKVKHVEEWFQYIYVDSTTSFDSLDYVKKFVELKIDGKKLLNITEKDLQIKFSVKVYVHRKKLIRHIRSLKRLTFFNYRQAVCTVKLMKLLGYYSVARSKSHSYLNPELMKNMVMLNPFPEDTLHFRQSFPIRIFLLRTKPVVTTKLLIRYFNPIHTNTSRREPKYRSVLVIGNFFLEWCKNSLCIPLYVENKFQKKIEQKVVYSIPPIGYLRYDSKDILLEKICEICSIWNGYRFHRKTRRSYYDEKKGPFISGTCQEFIDEVLLYLGVDDEQLQEQVWSDKHAYGWYLHQLRTVGVVENGMRFEPSEAFRKSFLFDQQCCVKNNGVMKFKSHEELDLYVEKIQSEILTISCPTVGEKGMNCFKKQFWGDYLLLEIFDRCFWMKDAKLLNDERIFLDEEFDGFSEKKRTKCLFGHPAVGVIREYEERREVVQTDMVERMGYSRKNVEKWKEFFIIFTLKSENSVKRILVTKALLVQ